MKLVSEVQSMTDKNKAKFKEVYPPAARGLAGTDTDINDLSDNKDNDIVDESVDKMDKYYSNLFDVSAKEYKDSIHELIDNQISFEEFE